MEEILENWVTKGVPSFAKGLHVLVVDHDKESLQSIASMLEYCSYKVTTTELANAALTMISEADQKDQPFKLVMANACNIPDMSSSLSFLHSLLQMDISIVLMFSEIDMNMASRTIAELGCHFLQKPISMEDIELVWQYVYRKHRNLSTKELSRKENVNAGKKSQLGNMNIGEADQSMSGKVEKVAVAGEFVHEISLIEQEGMNEKDESNGDKYEEMRVHPAAKFDLETTKITEEDKKKNRNGSTSKRSRIVWGSKLHSKFTEALSRLGDKKSSPKIILKMMNEPTLTLRQVASHLQKYKSQVKHLNNTASIVPAGTYCSVIRHNLTQSLVPICFNGPKLPLGNVVFSDLRMLNQNYPNSEYFVQTSQSNLQYSTADADYPFLPADNQCPDAIQELEFAPNLVGCLYSKNQNHPVMESSGKTEGLLLISEKISSSNSMDVGNLAADVTDENLNPNLDTASVVHPPPADFLNHNAALKELDDLLNNTEEDSMGYFCFDGEPNSVDID